MKAMETAIIGQKLRGEDQKVLFNLIKELDFTNPKQFTLLFSFKADEANRKIRWVSELASGYV
jgi:hypothetical protein